MESELVLESLYYEKRGLTNLGEAECIAPMLYRKEEETSRVEEVRNLIKTYRALSIEEYGLSLKEFLSLSLADLNLVIGVCEEDLELRVQELEKAKGKQ